MGATRVRRALAIMAGLGGALALVAGDPYAVKVDVHRLAKAVAQEEDHVTADELAQWIRDRKPGLRLIDVRTPAEYNKSHFPRAENVPIESIASVAFGPSETIVLLSEGGAHAAQAWVFLQALGYRNVYFLRGGMQETVPPDGRRYVPGRDGC